MIMIRFRICLVLLSIFCICPKGNCASQWEDFIQSPSTGVSRLRFTISPMAGVCGQIALPNQAESHQLIGMVQQGNELAFRAALFISKCFDVGGLEDFYRAAGIFFEGELEIAIEYKVSRQDLQYMVTMLPLDLVDNLQGRITKVNNRIEIIGGIADEPLNGIKSTVLSSLKMEKASLEKTRSDAEH